MASAKNNLIVNSRKQLITFLLLVTYQETLYYVCNVFNVNSDSAITFNKN
jgi:hypothetical protein